MKIGFTGTRQGMTSEQMASFCQLMSEIFPLTEFHHGDCIGADDEAANMMSEMRGESDMDTRNWKIIVHPPADETHRAFNEHYEEMMEQETHFARNRNIVDACDLLIGCPYLDTWQKHGGTFYTMDRAIKKGKPVKVIWPDGRIEDK